MKWGDEYEEEKDEIDERQLLNKLQLKYLKWLLGLNRNTLTNKVLDESRRDELRIEETERTVKF